MSNNQIIILGQTKQTHIKHSNNLSHCIQTKKKFHQTQNVSISASLFVPLSLSLFVSVFVSVCKTILFLRRNCLRLRLLLRRQILEALEVRKSRCKAACTI